MFKPTTVLRRARIKDYRGYQIHVLPRSDCERWGIEVRKNNNTIFMTSYGYHNWRTGVIRAKKKIDKAIMDDSIELEIEYVFGLGGEIA